MARSESRTGKARANKNGSHYTSFGGCRAKPFAGGVPAGGHPPHHPACLSPLPLAGEGRVRASLARRCGSVAITDSRPCVFCPPSMAASYFLLLAQKKVTKEKGTLGFAPSPLARVRCGWTGSAHRASCPVVRIGAIPRAARVRCTRLFRPPSAATQRGPQEQGKNRRVGYIRRFCGRDCRALLSGFPLGRGKGAEEKPRSGGRQDAGHFDESTGMCSRRSPP